ncbi:Uncharacterized protein F44E2.2 [Harpegnathos saltator]|uniref:RNA-directed DNA polymerase n=1 Tax=Harpegnathos saltator TaxID=610380 RepID=E2BQY4_HARSA|nr:Uncharacterized protein F44E2.2 [Harpegnathos saltator]
MLGNSVLDPSLTGWGFEKSSILNSTGRSAIAKSRPPIDPRIRQMSEQFDEMKAMVKGMAVQLEFLTKINTNKPDSDEPKMTTEQWNSYRVQKRYGSNESIETKDDARSQISAVSANRDHIGNRNENNRMHERRDDRDEDLYDPEHDREYISERHRSKIPRCVEIEAKQRYATRDPPRGNPFGELGFSGRGDSQHPIRFFDDFIDIADYEELRDRDRLYFFKHCMTGRAREWFDLQEFREFGEVVIKFRNKFWGRVEQNKLRDRVRNGMYNANTGRTMAEYVEKFARDVKYISPQIPEFELVQDLSQHFTVEIYNDLLRLRVDTIPELCHQLNIIQDYEHNRIHMAIKEKMSRELEAAQRSARYKPYGESIYGKRDEPEYPRQSPDRKYQREPRSDSRDSRRGYYSAKRAEFRDYRDPPTKWIPRKETSREYVDRRESSAGRKGGSARNNERFEEQRTDPRSRSANRDNRERSRQVKNERVEERISTPRDPSGTRNNRENSRQRDVSRQREPARERETSRIRETSRPRESSRSREQQQGVSSLRTEEILTELREFERREQNFKEDNKNVPIINVAIIAEKGEQELDRLSVRTLLDTGATVSAIDPSVIRNFEQRIREDRKTEDKELFPRVRINKTHMRGAFNQKGVHTNALVQLTIEMKDMQNRPKRYTHEFYAIETLFIPMILGADFLGKYRIAVTCPKPTALIATNRTVESNEALDLRMPSTPEPVHETTVKWEIIDLCEPEPGIIKLEEFEAKEPKNENLNASRESLHTRSEEGSEDACAPETEGLEDTLAPAIEDPEDPLAPRVEDPENSLVSTDENFTHRLENLLEHYSLLLDGSLGKIRGYEHEIRMTTDKPFKGKSYPIPQKHLEEVRRQLREMENLGVVSRAATQYISPLVAVTKPNGKIRICLDARNINDRMENDHAQPPTIEEVLANIGHKSIFSKLDITQAYWQIPLTANSRQYTGFSFDHQTYIFERLPFGIKTAGASFTRAIEAALKGKPELRKHVIVYLDDVLIASENETDHLSHLASVFEALQEAGFRLNRDKCEFARDRIVFLGHDITRVHVTITEETKRNIVDFPRPRNKKEIQAFLGLVNWDRRFVPKLSRHTVHLEKLLKKDTRFQWDQRMERAFSDIKESVRNAPSLYLINPDRKYGIETDASTVGIGARLFQYDDAGREYTIAYASRSLKGAERRYTVTEVEGLALVWCLKKWRVLLMGRPVRVKTDHRALKFISACAVASQRMARWLAFLQEFDLDINHIPGTANTTADALSRKPVKRNHRLPTERTTRWKRYRGATDFDSSSASEESDPSHEWDHEGRKMYVPRICLMADIHEGENTRDWVNLIREAQINDPAIIQRTAENPERYRTRNGFVRKTMDDGSDRVVIPD